MSFWINNLKLHKFCIKIKIIVVVAQIRKQITLQNIKMFLYNILNYKNNNKINFQHRRKTKSFKLLKTFLFV